MIGFRELLIIRAIALVIFGAKRLKNIGSDLGGAVRGFKKAMSEGEEEGNKQLSGPAGQADEPGAPAGEAGRLPALPGRRLPAGVQHRCRRRPGSAAPALPRHRRTAPLAQGMSNSRRGLNFPCATRIRAVRQE